MLYNCCFLRLVNKPAFGIFQLSTALGLMPGIFLPKTWDPHISQVPIKNPPTHKGKKRNIRSNIPPKCPRCFLTTGLMARCCGDVI